ncbi:hypothetical protein [Aurantivibrio infirmus]
MQFSVIIEGPISRATPSEESLSELERYLKSLKRSPEFIEQLKSGTPQVVKENLTYKQAEVISDRLMEFGLDSVIDPPSKTDSKSATSFSQTNVATKNVVKPSPHTQQHISPSNEGTSKSAQTPTKTAEAKTPEPVIATPIKKEVATSANRKDKNQASINTKKEDIPQAKNTAPVIAVEKSDKTSQIENKQASVQGAQKKERPNQEQKPSAPKTINPQKPKTDTVTTSTPNNIDDSKKIEQKNTKSNVKPCANVEPIIKSKDNDNTEKKYSVSAVLAKTEDKTDLKNSGSNTTNVVPITPTNNLAARKPLLTQAPSSEGVASKKQNSVANKQPKKTPAESPLNKSAEEIKALFNLANAKNIAIETPRFNRTKSYGLAVLSILAPVTYAAGLIISGVITFSIIGFVFGLVAKLSPMLAIILLLIPSLLVLSIMSILSIPLWIKTKSDSRYVDIKIQDEPKLFMLVTALCKIINVPTPEKIQVGLEANIRSGMSAKLKDFFTFSQELPERTSIRIGAPLLENLSIKDFSYFCAKECGRFADPTTRRSQYISQAILNWLNDLNNREFKLSEYLERKIGLIANEKLNDAALHLTNRIKNLESIESFFFGHCEQKLLFLSNTEKSTAARYGEKILNAQDAATSRNRITDIEDATQRSIDEMVANIKNRRFVKNISELSAHFYQKNKANTEQNRSAQSDLISNNGPLKALIKNLDPVSEKLTLNFYERENIVVSSESLLSVAELFKRNKTDNKQEKIAKEYLSNWPHGLQFWKLPKETSIKDIDENSKITKLNNCIEKIRYLSPDRAPALDYYYKLLKQLTELKAAKKIKSSGNSFRFQYCSDPSNNLDREIRSRETKLKEYADDINLQNCVMGERIALGLLLNKDSEKLSTVLYTSLTKLHAVCEKLNIIARDAEELSILNNYKPKQMPQHYQLHIRELTERINGNCKLVQRKLSDCLFNYYDKKKLSIDEIITDRMLPFSEHSANQLCIDRAKVTLSTVSTAFQHTSEIAANLATKSENLYGIETVKKL